MSGLRRAVVRADRRRRGAGRGRGAGGDRPVRHRAGAAGLPPRHRDAGRAANRRGPPRLSPDGAGGERFGAAAALCPGVDADGESADRADRHGGAGPVRPAEAQRRERRHAGRSPVRRVPPQRGKNPRLRPTGSGWLPRSPGGAPGVPGGAGSDGAAAEPAPAHRRQRRQRQLFPGAPRLRLCRYLPAAGLYPRRQRQADPLEAQQQAGSAGSPRPRSAAGAQRPAAVGAPRRRRSAPTGQRHGGNGDLAGP